MGILGRRRARKPAGPSPEALELLRRQLASPDPVLRLLAGEVERLRSPTNPCRQCGRPAGCTCAARPPRCRYCGRVSAFGWSNLICEKCDRVRTRIEAGAMSKFSEGDRRGWTGPPTIGDDELLVTFSRRLRDADQRRIELEEKDARRTFREQKARCRYSGIKVGPGDQQKPQKPWGLGDEVRGDFAGSTAETA
jgi:hypothetical protein